jgi:hypothetical protein
MTLKQALIQGQGLTSEEASEIIADMRKQVLEGADPEDLLYDEGLEPDYIFDLL